MITEQNESKPYLLIFFREMNPYENLNNFRY